MKDVVNNHVLYSITEGGGTILAHVLQDHKLGETWLKLSVGSHEKTVRTGFELCACVLIQ